VDDAGGVERAVASRAETAQRLRQRVGAGNALVDPGAARAVGKHIAGTLRRRWAGRVKIYCSENEMSD
jgi:hypothetical protein